MNFGADDIALLFDPDMPGYAQMTIGSTAHDGLFGDGYIDVQGVACVRPVFQVSAATAALIAIGSTGTLAGTTYKVTSKEQDGSGAVRILLEKQ